MKKEHLIHKINEKSGALETYDMATGELVLTNGISISHGFVYSERMGEAICEMLASGKSLSAISRIDHMPSISTMARWARLYPEFGQRMKAARAARAEVYRDKAEQLLEETFTKEDVAVNKFKFEGYMRLAGTDAPEIYGGATPTGQSLPSLKLVINTGIVRGDVEAIQGVDYEEIGEGADRLKVRVDGFGGADGSDGGRAGGDGASEAGGQADDRGGAQAEAEDGSTEEGGTQGQPEDYEF